MKLLIIAGARPNFMKIAPLIHAIEREEDSGRAIEYRLVHTGQHYDEKMSSVFFGQLGIPEPDINLEVGSGSHATQTANVMVRFEEVCERERPDWVVVVGDVNSTVACTLVAVKMGIKVAHVEAGLRSFDRTMPEEINRLVTDAIADLLLTPSEDGSEHLRKDGVAEDKIKLVGNIMIDALVSNLEESRASDLPQRLGLNGDPFVYVTLHRPSNVDHKESLEAIIGELKEMASRMDVVFPMHPRSLKMCQKFGISLNDSERFRVIDPVGYHDSLYLTENARFIVTDSGGLQEESTFFQTPCLTMRPNTERPVTVTVGSNKLTTADGLRDDIAGVLGQDRRIGAVPDLWDGHTAERIIDALFEAG